MGKLIKIKRKFSIAVTTTLPGKRKNITIPNFEGRPIFSEYEVATLQSMTAAEVMALAVQAVADAEAAFAEAEEAAREADELERQAALVMWNWRRQRQQRWY